MICGTCGGTEVQVLDGIDYCRECNSQFKGSQTEESSEEFFTKKALLSSPTVKKTAKDNRKFYDSWISTEAYNLIIAKQVSELIKLGCSKNLKDVVFHIWAQYLQKCEVAFRKKRNPEDDITHLSVYALKRDVKLLFGDGRSERRDKKSKTILKPKVQDAQEKNEMNLLKENEIKKDIEAIINSSWTDESSQMSSSIFDNSESSSDSPSTEVTTDEESSDSTSDMFYTEKKKKFSSAARKYMDEKKNSKKTHTYMDGLAVHHMTLAKTLSFCHLGLLYTEDQLLMFDLIRLINEDNVPYIDVTRHFPPSMQMQATDHTSYTKYYTPEMRTICLTSAQLMKFLKLPKFKHPPLLPIAIRFVKDLNLPNDIIPALKIVIEDFESKRNQSKKEKVKMIPLYEVQAMAAIIVVLKMLLILDGSFEVEHDEVMVKLNTVVEDYKFFIWSEWKQQAEMKEYLFLKNGFNYTEMSRLDSLCIERIIENHHHCFSELKESSHFNRKTKKEYSSRNTLKNVLEKITSLNPQKKRPTSFPLKYELQRFMTEWKRLPIYKETTNIDFSFINRDFSHDKFCYKQFDASTNPDDLINILYSSLYEPVEIFRMVSKGGYVENIVRTTKNYWYLNIPVSTFQADNKRSEDRKGKWLEGLPSSFKWLLIFLSKYLQVTCADLYLEVKEIERQLRNDS